MPRSSEEEREQQRQILLEACLRCMERTGFRHLTVEDICAEAGVSQRSFHQMFRDIGELLLGVASAGSADADEALLPLTEKGSPRTHCLANVLRHLVADADRPGRARLGAELWAEAVTDESLRLALAIGLRRRREVLAGWLADAARAGELRYLPPNAFAAVMLAVADGLVVHAGLDPGGYDSAQIHEALSVLLQPLEP